jgi:hypothetical protein
MVKRCYIVFIVGDSFVRFAEHDNVMTVNQLLHAFTEGCMELHLLQLLPGLGLDASDCEAVQKTLRRAGASAETVSRFERAGAALALTHKHDSAHVMIGTVEPKGEAEYRSEMIVSRLEDRLSDHVTGQHVGGMLLVEAARQIAIAAVELEYGEGGRKRWGMAWSGMRVSFSAYLFPLPTTLIVRCREDAVKTKPNHRAITMAVTVEQADRSVCEIEMEVTLMDARVLAKIEHQAATRALSRLRVDPQRSESAGVWSHAN